MRIAVSVLISLLLLTASLFQFAAQVLDSSAPSGSFILTSPKRMYELGNAAAAAQGGGDADLCRAASYYRAASARSPFQPAYQLAWAAAEARIKDVDQCPADRLRPSVALDAQERIAIAAAGAPQSSRNLQLAALAYLALGDKQRALASYRVAAEKSTYFPETVRSQLYAEIKSEADLRTALPHRLGQFLPWFRFFREHRPREYALWQPAFADAANSALDAYLAMNDPSRLASEEVSSLLWELSVTDLAATDPALRRKTDRLLARALTLQERTSAAEFFQWRAERTRLPVAKAFMTDDVLPEQQSLSGWKNDAALTPAALTRTGHSIGVLIPENSGARNLVLQFSRSNPQLEPDSIRLLGSADNISFTALQNCTRGKSFAFRRHQFIVLGCRETLPAFVKVYRAGPRQTAQAQGPLFQILQVYE